METLRTEKSAGFSATCTYVILPKNTDKNEFIADKNRWLATTWRNHLNTRDYPRTETLF